MAFPQRSRRADSLGKTVALLAVVAIALSGCAPTVEEALSNIQVSYIVSEPLDFIQHLVAHVDIGQNAATNYDPAYLQRIRDLKADYPGSILDLENELRPAQALGMDLIYLQILGLYCKDVSELVSSLRFLAGDPDAGATIGKTATDALASLSPRLSITMDERQLLMQFSVSAAREYETFYREYRTRNLDFFETQAGSLARFMSQEGLRVVAPSFRRGGLTKITVWLSQSRRVNGLGLNYEGGMGAVVRLPEGEDGIYYTYFFLVHELTHALSDPITYKVTGYNHSERDTAPGTAGYAVHRAVEDASILAGYWIFKSAGGDLPGKYLEFLKGLGRGSPLDCDLSQSLKNSLQRQFSKR